MPTVSFFVCLLLLPLTLVVEGGWMPVGRMRCGVGSNEGKASKSMETLKEFFGPIRCVPVATCVTRILQNKRDESPVCPMHIHGDCTEHKISADDQHDVQRFAEPHVLLALQKSMVPCTPRRV